MEPKGKSAFLKQVILLTNDKTVSEGDLFTMLMKELPQVKIVGTNSSVVYSDMYGFTLPNKWLISLSNHLYLNAVLICYECIGTQ